MATAAVLRMYIVYILTMMLLSMSRRALCARNVDVC
jgi:hypothetical protein